MSKESTQKRIAKDRAPRVQISYDVEIGDATETKELPFVLGVLGDYAGHPAAPLPKLKDRKFVQIDGESFDDVLKGIGPQLAIRVENSLRKDGSELPVELRFERLEDFEPGRLVEQVEPLRKLLEARTRLSDLRGKLAGNGRLEDLLEKAIQDTETLRTLAKRGDSEE